MILCCGEALIDMVPIDGGFAPLAGGAIFNTAIALGRLGAPTGFLSGMSTDLFGQQLESVLAESHVDYGLAIRSKRPTTLAFVKLTNGHAQYTFYDENSAGRMITADDLPTLPKSVEALYFGGISLCAEPAANTYKTLCLRGAADNVVMIDPNIRQGFISDETTYRARVMSMIAASDIVKVSDEDLDWLVKVEADQMTKLASLRASGPSIALLTRGSEGARALFGDNQTLEVASQKVEVRDTVGAGDTFNAGVLASLRQAGVLTKAALRNVSADAMRDALSYGAKVAAVTVSRDGANPPWVHELTD